MLIGATGYTGTLVAHELAARGWPYLLAGRNASKLESLAAALGGAKTALVDARRPATLERALRPGDVVINCVGPFTDYGEPIVRAAIEAGADYVDTTGEQRFMANCEERLHDAATRAGVAVVNAMAFEYALGDCGAALAAEGLARPLRAVDVTYAWRGGRTSRGTRRSVLRILAERGFVYEDGHRQAEPTGVRRRIVQLDAERERTAVSFPAGEIVTVPRHLATSRVRGWAVVGRRAARWLPAFARSLPAAVRLTGPLAELVIRRGPEGPTPAERVTAEALILVSAEDETGTRGEVRIRAWDPYGLTAAIAVMGAERLLEGTARRGVLAPAQLVEPRALLDGLRERDLTWERTEGYEDAEEEI